MTPPQQRSETYQWFFVNTTTVRLLRYISLQWKSRHNLVEFSKQFRGENVPMVMHFVISSFSEPIELSLHTMWSRKTGWIWDHVLCKGWSEKRSNGNNSTSRTERGVNCQLVFGVGSVHCALSVFSWTVRIPPVYLSRTLSNSQRGS